MKYLLFSDIHGCLPALEKVLDFFEKEKCDMMCIMGDIINYDIDNVVRGRIVSVSNKLMMKNLVVSELLSIFAVFFRAAFLRASHFRAGM